VTVYVLYDGDDVIGVGTASELARLLGVTQETIKGYAKASYKALGRDRVAERVTVRPEDFSRMSR
jgi:hypothetical protein